MPVRIYTLTTIILAECQFSNNFPDGQDLFDFLYNFSHSQYVHDTTQQIIDARCIKYMLVYLLFSVIFHTGYERFYGSYYLFHSNKWLWFIVLESFGHVLCGRTYLEFRSIYVNETFKTFESKVLILWYRPVCTKPYSTSPNEILRVCGHRVSHCRWFVRLNH